MRNIRLEIEYDGTNYYGWQIQRHKVPVKKSPQSFGETKSQRHRFKTIQETIENVLQKILQEKIKLICSGRTDTGVHAKAQVANFKTKSPVALDKLHLGLNALLPEDISVKKVRVAPDDFHSRFGVKSKIYRYIIFNNPHRSALSRNFVHCCRYPLDLKRMRCEAKSLLGRHNFRSFCASAGLAKNPVKTIKNITIKKLKDLIYIDIEADGFLYNMARNIVGTLIDVGRGRFAKHSCRKILLSKNRRLAGPTAPAKGLYLFKVKYKEKI